VAVVPGDQPPGHRKPEAEEIPMPPRGLKGHVEQVRIADDFEAGRRQRGEERVEGGRQERCAQEFGRGPDAVAQGVGDAGSDREVGAGLVAGLQRGFVGGGKVGYRGGHRIGSGRAQVDSPQPLGDHTADAELGIQRPAGIVADIAEFETGGHAAVSFRRGDG
jgi:hypothetical protein